MSKGFSLLELMVVVAIIAILSTAAIPMYRLYILTAKLTTARDYVASFDSQIRDFYSSNGTFPTNSDLGISTSVPTSVQNYLYAPYVADLTIAPQTTTGTQCPYGTAIAYFSNYDGDYFANGTSRYVVFYNYYIDHLGTMVEKCAFYEHDPSTNQDTSNFIFKDCVQTNSPNTSAIMTYINTACS